MTTDGHHTLARLGYLIAYAVILGFVAAVVISLAIG